MDNAIKKVKLLVRERGAEDKQRVITTLTRSSRFTTMPWFNRLNNCTDEQLMKAVKEQRDGWKFNGPWPNAVFEIKSYDFNDVEILS